MTTLLRSSDAAKKLDITEYQLYAKTREGIIPAVKIGRMIRWNEEALNDFIQAGGKSYPGGWKKEA